MKIKGNCREYTKDIRFECPFLRRPFYHSGYTSKSGPETWWHCILLEKPIRNIPKCELAGNPGLHKEACIQFNKNKGNPGPGGGEVPF